MNALIEREGRRRPLLADSAARLLAAAAAGDAAAIGELFDRFGVLFAASISAVRAEAAERDRLCTEAFAAVWRRAGEGARSPEPVLWLLEVLCETLQAEPGLARCPIGRGLLALRCPDREVLLLAAAGRYSQAEIADLTGIAEPQLRRILCSALATLRGDRGEELLTA